MIGLHHSVISDDSEDVSDGVEVEFFTDSKAQKFKEFSDTQLDDEIEKYEGYVAGTRKAALNLPDGGNKFTKHLESLRSEKHKRARKLKRALAVCLCRRASLFRISVAGFPSSFWSLVAAQH